MYFEFNEHKLKQNNLTQEQCFRVIDKVMNEYGVHANISCRIHPLKYDSLLQMILLQLE